MKILKLAGILTSKYAESSPDKLEDELRKDINTLWKYPNELFNILKACAESQPRAPKDAHQMKALGGFKFCQELLSMIDYLQSKVDTISLGEIREILVSIVDLVKTNKDVKFDVSGKISDKGEISGIQFPHVSALIFEMIPATTKHGRTIRDQQFGKAKTGLSRILSFTLSMLEKISKLEIMVPEKFTYTNVTDVDINNKLPERFEPQRAPLSIYDIIDFIRQYGDEWGIPTFEDWGTVLRDDPILKDKMTTIINAINRGHSPKDASSIKLEIAKILKEFEERR